jgi:hypothetical protein
MRGDVNKEGNVLISGCFWRDVIVEQNPRNASLKDVRAA